MLVKDMQRSPDVEAIRRGVAETDPILLDAAAEVDLELLQWMLQLSPLERLRVASRASRALASFRRVAP